MKSNITSAVSGALFLIALSTDVVRADESTVALNSGDGLVIMDTLLSHKGPKVRELIEAAGARLLYLPPCSPDLNPIENAFAKVKALLRRAAKRTVEGLWSSIGELLTTSKPAEYRNDFAAAEYDTD